LFAVCSQRPSSSTGRPLPSLQDRGDFDLEGYVDPIETLRHQE
jgi:hypothetical protein